MLKKIVQVLHIQEVRQVHHISENYINTREKFLLYYKMGHGNRWYKHKRKYISYYKSCSSSSSCSCRSSTCSCSSSSSSSSTCCSCTSSCSCSSSSSSSSSSCCSSSSSSCSSSGRCPAVICYPKYYKTFAGPIVPRQLRRRRLPLPYEPVFF